MAKSTISSWQTQRADSFLMQNVLQVNIQNYSVDPVDFVFNGIKRTLPGIDPILEIPVAPFRIHDYGNEFDVVIDFIINKAGSKIVVDYSQLKKC